MIRFLFLALAALVIVPGPLARVRARRFERQCAEIEVDRLVWAWRAACDGAGVSRTVSTVTGPTTVTPRVVEIVFGPPMTLCVELLPGMVAGDVRAVASRLAPHLGAVMIRVEPRGLRYVLVRLLQADPLDVEVSRVQPVDDRVFLGRGEDGREVAVDPSDLGHVLVAGQSGSGKSTFLYGVVAGLVARARSCNDVLVAGVDPSGLLLRPFAGTRHAAWQTCGLGDLDRVESVLTALVREMDRRIATLPVWADSVATHTGCPRVWLFLEELPALYRALDGDDPKRGKRVRVLVARLLAESRKAGFSVVLVAQRPEASLIGSADRAQTSTRVTFRPDNADAVRLA